MNGTGLRAQLFRRKPAAALMAEAESRSGGLKRALGALDLTLLGIGAIVGAGIFVLTGVAAARDAGPAIVVSFVVSGFACAMAALCYAEFAAMIPVAGSAYSYSYATMGELVAWIIGWDLVLEYAVGAAAVASGWSGYLAILLKGLGIELPRAWTHAPFSTPGAIMNLPALVIVLLISYVLYIGISESARLNSIIVGLKLFVIGAVIVVGAFFVKPANWSPFAPMGWSGVMRGARCYILRIYWIRCGLDGGRGSHRSEARPAARHPRFAVGVYCAVYPGRRSPDRYGACQGIDITAPLASAFLERGMHAISGLISLGAVAGLTSVLLVLMLGQSRVFFAVSRDGLLPPAFSRIHPKYRTPYIPTTLTGIAVGIAAAFLPIDEMGEMTNIGTLFAFVLVCIGVWILRNSEPDLRARFARRWFLWFPFSARSSACT